MYREDEFYEDEEEVAPEKPTVQVRNLTNGKVYPAEVVHKDGDIFWSVRFTPESVGSASALFKNVNGKMVARFMDQELQLIIAYK